MTASRRSRTIVYSSPFVPAEWIEAHGLIPLRLVPSTIPAGGIVEAQAGICPYMGAFVNLAALQPECAGLVFTTACDQFRRAVDLLPAGCGLSPFLMNVPATRRGGAPRQLYAEELARLGRYLVKAGGRRPGDPTLREILLRHDAVRARERALAAAPAASGSVAVGVVGGPLTLGQRGLYDVIHELGGRVTVDGSEGGVRTLAAPVDPATVKRDPFGALVDAYHAIPDIFHRPNDAFYEWLGKALTGLRGVIVVRQVWCDLWHAEVARIREAAGVPVLDVELNDNTVPARLRLRLEAFMEVIR